MAAFYVVLVTLSLSTLIVYDYTEERLDVTREKLDELSENRFRTSGLWEEWQDLQFNVRGYALFGDPDVLARIKKQEESLDQQTEWFERNSAYEEGKTFAKRSRELHDYYFDAIIPAIEEYVAAKESGEVKEVFLDGRTLVSLPIGKRLFDEGKIKLDSEGNIDVLTQIGQIESIMGNYRELLRDEGVKASEQLEREIQNSQLIWLSNILVLVLVLFLFVYPFIRRITAELLSLVKNSQRLANGEDVSHVEVPDRKDEIGILALSFNQMAASISENKQHLLAKNEELQAQQEELVAQQEELQAQQQELEEALELTMRNEKHLAYRNELTETLAARESLTAYPEIIEKLVSITESEIGALVFTDETGGHHVTTYGMSESLADQLIGNDFSLLSRARSLKRPVHSSKQVSSDHPLPYPYYMYETAVPILDPATEKVIACIYLVRYRDQFTSEQLREIMSFARQLSLSILRMQMFDEMEREKSKTERILDSIREAVIYVEQDTEEVFVNGPLYELFPEIKRQGGGGFDSITACLETLSPLVDQPELLERYVNDALSGKFPEEELQFSIREKCAFIQFYVEPIDVGPVRKGLLLVLRDVTKETEADRLKTEFVSTVSHELRTPLSSIYGYTELMLNRDIEIPKQHKYLKTIHSETERLANLVNDFLDVQRMESGKLSYKKAVVDILPLFEEMTSFYAASTDRHTISFAVKEQVPQLVEADEEKLKQLLSNLLSNAVKYSPDGGNIRVELNSSAEEVHISVSDEGIGIPKEAVPKLFEKFYRVDNSDSRKIGGTGLGLAICKEIVTGHGGRITVESVERSGTIFHIRLPLLVGQTVSI